MNQHDIFKALQIFAVLQNGKIRADGRAGRQHPERVTVGDFIQHEEPRRVGDNLHFIARLQRGEAWAELTVRDGDQIELKVRVIRRINVRVGALYAFTVDIQPELGKLPGSKRMNGSVQREAK